MHMFWYGVLAGTIVGAFAPGGLKALAIGAALVLSGLLEHLFSHGHLHLPVPSWLIAVLGVAFGLWAWHRGRLRGLQHLGTHELRTRWANVRGVSRW
jgi:hypothetical protein